MTVTDIQREKIYRDYHGKVCGYIRSRINDMQDAEDIAANVFVKVYEKLDSFDKSRAITLNMDIHRHPKHPDGSLPHAEGICRNSRRS